MRRQAPFFATRVFAFADFAGFAFAVVALAFVDFAGLAFAVPVFALVDFAGFAFATPAFALVDFAGFAADFVFDFFAAVLFAAMFPDSSVGG